MHPQVDQYIESLPEPLREVAEQVRLWIFDLVPGVDERFSFRIPFYYYHGMFLYLTKQGNGLDISFCRGKDLVFAYPELQQGKRAMVASLHVESLAELKKLPARALIQAAAAWNEEAHRNKIPMINKSAKKR